MDLKRDIIVVVIALILALTLAFVAEQMKYLTMEQNIIILAVILIIVGFSYLLTYILNIDRRTINLSNFDKSNKKFEESLKRLDSQFEESLNRLDSHIYSDKGIINFEDISRLINESDAIYVFNPLKKIDYFDESIKASVVKGCVRRFIVSESDKHHFENYKKCLEEELHKGGLLTNINVEDYFKIASWNNPGRPLIPISVVISRKNDKKRVWLHPSGDNIVDESKYAFYLDDPTKTFHYESWFIKLWEKLTKEDIKI